MHVSSGNWKLGFLLALLTTLLWGALPIALKALLDVMDPYTLTWYRFLAAAFLLGGFLAYRRRLPDVVGLGRSGLALLLVAVLGALANYVFYLLGLDYVSPGTAQVVIQLAPLFLLLGGVLVFKESFGGRQWLGFAVLVAGLGMFFNDRLSELLRAEGLYSLGVGLVVIASVTWAAYGLALKQLLRSMASEQVMLVVYAGSFLLLMPFSDASQIVNFDGVTLALLAFASLNTLIAYGCFAEALEHWEASRVSAVIATSPLLTLIFMTLVHRWIPGFVSPEQLNTLSTVGAVLVVLGSIVTALGEQRPKIDAGH